MSGKIPWLVSLIGSLATAELLLSQRPASHLNLLVKMKDSTKVEMILVGVGGDVVDQDEGYGKGGNYAGGDL